MIINEIVIIRFITAIIFLVTLFYSMQLYQKTKNKTNIWFIISIYILFAFLESTFNVFEWAEIFTGDLVDLIGEYLGIIFLTIWVYVAYKFVSLSKTNTSFTEPNISSNKFSKKE